jgi:hypothetical protein
MTMQRDPDQFVRIGLDRRHPHGQRGAPQRSALQRSEPRRQRRLLIDLRRRTYVARAEWLGGAWAAVAVEGSNADVVDVRAVSLAALPDAIRRQVAAYERIAIARIEILVCTTTSDVEAWLEWRGMDRQVSSEPASAVSDAATEWSGSTCGGM